MRRLGWKESELTVRSKSRPDKQALAARLRGETILSIRVIAARVHLGTSKSANARLHQWMGTSANTVQNQPDAAGKTDYAMGWSLFKTTGQGPGRGQRSEVWIIFRFIVSILQPGDSCATRALRYANT